MDCFKSCCGGDANIEKGDQIDLTQEGTKYKNIDLTLNTYDYKNDNINNVKNEDDDENNKNNIKLNRNKIKWKATRCK